MTQWYWRVTNIENFNLENQVEIGSFNVVNVKHTHFVKVKMCIHHTIYLDAITNPALLLLV